MFQNSFCITHVLVGKTCSFCMLLLDNFTYSKRNWDIHKPCVCWEAECRPVVWSNLPFLVLATAVRAIVAGGGVTPTWLPQSPPPQPTSPPVAHPCSHHLPSQGCLPCWVPSASAAASHASATGLREQQSVATGRTQNQVCSYTLGSLGCWKFILS